MNQSNCWEKDIFNTVPGLTNYVVFKQIEMFEKTSVTGQGPLAPCQN